MKVTSTRRKEPVILWGCEFCSWLRVLDELGLRPAAVIVSSLINLPLIRSVVGVDCFVGTEVNFVEVLLPTLRVKCRMGLVDRRLSQHLCSLAEKLDMSCLIGTLGLRRQILGWERDTLSLRHCEVGGITTALTQGACLIRGKVPPLCEPLLTIVARDASTVLSATALSHKFHPPPESRVVTPLGCVNLGSEGRAHYHGGGLLPEIINRRTCVLTPGVCAPEASWALRPLSVDVVLIAKDNGQFLACLLSSNSLNNGFLQNLVPGKLLLALARRWGCYGGCLFSS
jgi:hypothetical protein